jgi:hypothetical protein
LNSEKIWKIWKKIVKRYEKYGRKLWNDMENTEENSERIWKIWKKDKLNSDKIWKIRKKIMKIWKIRKKILKRYEKYGRNQSSIVKR